MVGNGQVISQARRLDEAERAIGECKRFNITQAEINLRSAERHKELSTMIRRIKILLTILAVAAAAAVVGWYVWLIICAERAGL